MQLGKPRELAWAVPKKEGFKGEASGLYFDFYETVSEAKKAQAWMKRNGKWTAKIECRPGEAYRLCG